LVTQSDHLIDSGPHLAHLAACFVHLQFDPASRDQKLILLKHVEDLLSDLIYSFSITWLHSDPLDCRKRTHIRKVARTSWEKV